MDDPNLDETLELLVGTWLAVAMVVEALIEKHLMSREELLLMLSEAAEASGQPRAVVFTGLRMLIERGFPVRLTRAEC